LTAIFDLTTRMDVPPLAVDPLGVAWIPARFVARGGLGVEWRFQNLPAGAED
jgi:hypothetical protein